jgi:hypothetical protein
MINKIQIRLGTIKYSILTVSKDNNNKTLIEINHQGVRKIIYFIIIILIRI